MVEPLTDDSKIVLALIRKSPGWSKVSLSSKLGISSCRVEGAILELQQRFLIETKKVGDIRVEEESIKRMIDWHIESNPRLKRKQVKAAFKRWVDNEYYPA